MSVHVDLLQRRMMWEHLYCWVDNIFPAQFYFQNCTSVGASSLESQGTYALPPISTPSFSASSGGLSLSGWKSCKQFFKSSCAIFFKSTPFLIRFADRGLVVGGQQYTVLLKKIHWTELAKKELPLWAECHSICLIRTDRPILLLVYIDFFNFCNLSHLFTKVLILTFSISVWFSLNLRAFFPTQPPARLPCHYLDLYLPLSISQDLLRHIPGDHCR